MKWRLFTLSGSATARDEFEVHALPRLLWAAFVAGVLLALAAPASAPLVTALLPAFRSELTLIDGNLSIRQLELAHVPAGDVVKLQANLLYPAYHQGKPIYPLGWQEEGEGWAEVRLSVSSVLRSAIVFLTTVLAWPWRGRRELLLRLVLAVPLGTLPLALDAPLNLLGNFQQSILRYSDPHGTSPLFYWARFLEGGGSATLALGMAAVAIGIAARVVHGAARKRPADRRLQ